MKVSEVMTPNVCIANPDDSLKQVAELMAKQDIGFLPVGDMDRLVGTITDRDIVVRAIAGGSYPATVKLAEICSQELTTLSPTDSVEEAVALMRDKSIRRLPVVEHGHPVGIVSLGDLAIEKDPHSALGNISAAPPNR